MGLGGFLDGIVLHQILQWHHMLSHTDDYPTNTVAGLEMNTLADGLFHVLAYVFTVAGLRRSGPCYANPGDVGRHVDVLACSLLAGEYSISSKGQSTIRSCRFTGCGRMSRIHLHGTWDSLDNHIEEPEVSDVNREG